MIIYSIIITVKLIILFISSMTVHWTMVDSSFKCHKISNNKKKQQKLKFVASYIQWRLHSVEG